MLGFINFGINNMVLLDNGRHRTVFKSLDKAFGFWTTKVLHNVVSIIVTNRPTYSFATKPTILYSIFSACHYYRGHLEKVCS